MTNGQKIEYLKQYLEIGDAKQIAEESFELYFSKVTSITAQLTDMPGGGGTAGDTVGGHVANLVFLRQALDERLRLMDKKRAEIKALIDGVENLCLQNLLTLKYLNGLKWEEIAVRLNYTWRHTHRLHSKALDQINI